MSKQSQQLKRLMDAAKGRPLSWFLALDIEKLIGGHHSGGDKLSKPDRAKVQVEIDRLIASGVKPAKTLLTPCQRKAQRRGREIGAL